MSTPKKVTELTESTSPQLTHYIPVHDGTGLKKVLLSYIKTLINVVTWGNIGGTLSNQTDLQNALNAKQASLGFTPENEANKKLSLADNSDTYYPSQKAVKTAVDAKQDTLVSGTNIKTINNTSLLGSGDISIAGASSIDIGTTPITGGASGQILFESASNKVSESANLTYLSGLLKILGTSEQLRVGYDGSNYLKVTVDSTGLTTYDAVGSGAGHYFADKILLGTTDNTDQSVLRIATLGGIRAGNTRIYDNNGDNALRGNTTAGGDNILFDSYGRICLRESAGRTIYYGTTYPPPASVGIGMASTTQGIGFPSMTGAQAEAITGLVDGIAIYCNNGNGTSITSTGFWGYGGGSWTKLG